MITIKVEGLNELDRKLRSFGSKVAANGLRSSTLAGTKVFLNAAKQTTAFKDVTGLLRANIVNPRHRTPPNVASYSVVVRGKKRAKVIRVVRKKKTGKYAEAAGPGIYARFLEYGTSKMRARPFLRPAFSGNITAAIEAVRAGLARAVERASQ